MKTVILAGGLGTRLQPYTTFLPKPMLPLGERPILEHLIEWSKKFPNLIKKLFTKKAFHNIIKEPA